MGTWVTQLQVIVEFEQQRQKIPVDFGRFESIYSLLSVFNYDNLILIQVTPPAALKTPYNP